jgi:hypothetical protein
MRPLRKFRRPGVVLAGVIAAGIRRGVQQAGAVTDKSRSRLVRRQAPHQKLAAMTM